MVVATVPTACLVLAALVWSEVAAINAGLPDDKLTATLRAPHVAVRVKADGGLAWIDCDCAPALRVEEVPDTVVEAVTAIEDHRFFRHDGVDFWAVARAFVANVWARRIVQGGSTLTQQLVKNTLLGSRRTLSRKIVEAVLARRVEHLLSKDEILRLYLGRIVFGHVKGRSVRGLREAARVYFGKTPAALDGAEAAILAGMLKAPSNYHPLYRTSAAIGRARVVLDRLAALGGSAAGEAALRAAGDTLRARARVRPRGRHRFVEDRAIREARSHGLLLRKSTVRLVLTMDPRMQRSAERVVALEMHQATARGARRAALVSLAPDGAVRALVGGTDYAKSQFNLATQAWRQGASTAKIATYLAALESGWTLRDIVHDTPARLRGRAPRNADGRYLGAVPLWRCFAESRNVCTTWLAQRVGSARIADMAGRLRLVRASAAASSIILGAAETTLLRNTAAYATLAANGAVVRPYTVIRAIGEDGRVRHEIDRHAPRRLVNAPTVTAMRELLRRAVVNGTGWRAAFAKRSFGKTGTSQLNRDAWFIGFTEDRLTTGVWVGPADGGVMRGVGGGLTPARVWRRFNANIAER